MLRPALPTRMMARLADALVEGRGLSARKHSADFPHPFLDRTPCHDMNLNTRQNRRQFIKRTLATTGDAGVDDSLPSARQSKTEAKSILTHSRNSAHN